MSELITAIVSVFKTDLSVDYDACCNLAEYLAENGSDGLVVSGTTGESPTLTDKEKLTLFSKIKDKIQDKGIVIAGTGYNDTESSIKLTVAAEKTGVDGFMVVAPYYNKPPQAGIIKHFQAVAEKTELPVIIYNVPSRTGVNIETQTVITLSRVENIVAIKEASGNFQQIKQIIEETSEDFKVYSGDDSATFEIMKLGGDGVISVASHIVGNQTKEMLRFCDSGDFGSAQVLNDKLMPVYNGLFETTNPILVKAGLELIGRDGGPLRLPLIEATEEQKTKLKELFISAGIIG